jgi:HK97 gp10 family phage protein
VTVKNADAIARALERALGALPGALSDAVSEVADDVRQSVSRPGGGTPAAPGEAPHLQTGELAASIKGTSKGTTGRIEVDAQHGQYQETGTSDSEPRPFFRDGVLKSANTKVPKTVGDRIIKAERKR